MGQNSKTVEAFYAAMGRGDIPFIIGALDPHQRPFCPIGWGVGWVLSRPRGDTVVALGRYGGVKFKDGKISRFPTVHRHGAVQGRGPPSRHRLNVEILVAHALMRAAFTLV
jgi:hypothetical protein